MGWGMGEGVAAHRRIWKVSRVGPWHFGVEPPAIGALMEPCQLKAGWVFGRPVFVLQCVLVALLDCQSVV